MLDKKLLVALLAIAIIGVTAVGLGCTSPTATPTTSTVGPHMDNLTAAFKDRNPNVNVQVSISDSGTGISSTENGKCDVGMSSRALTSSDGADLVGTVIAYDGIAIVVNNANPVTDLTKQQIKDIFAGNVTNWKQVGGNDAPITVFQREAASGTRSAFNSLVMGSTNVTAGALQATSTLIMAQNVKNSPNAIGYVSYGELAGSDVSALKVGGIAPSITTIKDKSYAIQRPFLFVTKGTSTNPIVVAFISFVTGPDGQAILAKDNLVGIA